MTSFHVRPLARRAPVASIIDQLFVFVAIFLYLFSDILASYNSDYILLFTFHHALNVHDFVNNLFHTHGYLYRTLCSSISLHNL